MILVIVVVIALFVVTRFLVLRDTGSQRRSGIAGGVVAIAFLAGYVTHAVNVPASEPSSSVGSAPAPVAETAPPAVPQADSSLTNVTKKCHSTKGDIESNAFGGFDEVAADDKLATPVEHVGILARNKEYMALGWGGEADHVHRAEGACLIVDGSIAPDQIALYGVNRPDVAFAYKAPDLTQAGYRILIPPRSLALGRHRLQVAIYTSDGKLSLITASTWDVSVR